MDGLVEEKHVGSIHIRYSNPGSALGGYSVKDASLPNATWIQVYSVSNDSSGNAISITHVPTGQSFPISSPNSHQGSTLRSISMLNNSQNSEQERKDRESCRQYCRDARDDAAIQIRNTYRTCFQAADSRYQNCLLIGGLGSAAAGAGVGSLGGPIGAAVGAIVGFVAGEVACLITGINEVNICKNTRDNDLNTIRQLFDRCIARCGEEPQ